MLYYNARYYDPALARFVSADSIVPGTAAGSGGTAATQGYDERVALRPLTVDFHETPFVSTLNAENAFTQANGFHFQLDRQARRQEKYQWGPLNPQALNRYAYVLNNPLRYTDPSGHYTELTADQAQDLQDQLVALMYAIGDAAISHNITTIETFLGELLMNTVIGKLLGPIAQTEINLAKSGKWSDMKRLNAELWDIYKGLSDFLRWERQHPGHTLGLDLEAIENNQGGDVSLILKMFWGGKLQRGYGLDTQLYYSIVGTIGECRHKIGANGCENHPSPSPGNPS